MKTDPAKFVCPGGVDFPQAIELARQIDAGEPNADQLVNENFSDYVAIEVAKQIRTGIPDIPRLQELMVSPELAHAIANAISDNSKDGTP